MYTRNPTDIKAVYNIIITSNYLHEVYPIQITGLTKAVISIIYNNPTGLLQQPTITLFYSHPDPDPLLQ